MDNSNGSNRPLSPHITIYRPQITSVLSIVHRITGAGLTLGMVLIVWWFVAAATSPGYFRFVDGLLTSWAGLLILGGSLWAFWFHFFNGIRHLRWDAGKGLSLAQSTRSGWRVLGFSVLATTVSVAWLSGGLDNVI